MALPFALRALDIREQAGNLEALSISCTNLGNIFLNMRDTARAAQHYSKALKIDYQLQDSIGISMAYTNMAILCYEGGQFKIAIPFLKKSIELNSVIGDDYNSMISYFNLGEAFFGLKKYEDALSAYQTSYKLSREINSASYIFNNGKQMAACHDLLGNQVEAY